ncbi:MAG: tetratricopeptide repeat protein [Christensenellales bacterium]
MDIKKITKAAKKDGKAGLLLARMYNEGVGVKQNDVKGLKTALQAAKTNPEAYNFVAYSYLKGYGVPVNLKKAEDFYIKATRADDGLAEYSLGIMYSSGILGKKGKKKESIADEYLDKAQAKNNCYSLFQEGYQLDQLSKINFKSGQKVDAIELQKASIDKFTKSAKAGCPNAQLALAIKLINGDGLKADYKRAWKLINRIDENELPMVTYCKGYMYDLGLGVQQDHWKAYEYFLKAHEEGIVQATIALGICALSGFGCDKNYSRALEYFKEAAGYNNSIAVYYIGYMFAEGLGVDKDLEKAAKYLNSAAEAEYAPAYYQLGRLYDKTIHKDNNNPDKCFEYYSTAVKMEYDEAKMGLANCYLRGAGVKQDPDIAYREMKELAELGNDKALDSLGNWYREEEAEPVKQDEDTAFKYFLQAAEAGNRHAISVLCRIYEIGLMKKEKDPVKAFEWKVALGKSGDSSVYFDLAKAYENGIKDVVERNGEMAAYWYAKCVRETDENEQQEQTNDVEKDKKGKEKSKKKNKKADKAAQQAKTQREIAANKLCKFAKDMDGNWDFKDEVAKRDKAKRKELKKNKGKKAKDESQDEDFLDDIAEA